MNRKYLASLKMICLLWVLCVMHSFGAKAQIINTIIGNHVAGFSGDGGTATAAQLNFAISLAFDSHTGDMFVADSRNNRIRKVTPAGIISTFAGTGTRGYSGDGGPASAATLRNPKSVAVDQHGNVFVSDADNRVVRKIDTTGTITTYAGDGRSGFAGDGGRAINATFRELTGISVDHSGNLYIADYYNGRVRKVNAAGIISTIAGNNGVRGYSGDGGAATAARLATPSGVVFDETSGKIYIADSYNDCIRMIDTAGIIHTVAGSRIRGFSGDGGPATAARFNIPNDVKLDHSGKLYIADAYNFRIRVYDPATGLINTFAGGTRGTGGDGRAATAAQIDLTNIAVDDNDNVYDVEYTSVRKINIYVSPIGGPSSICQGSRDTLHEVFTAGTWSSSTPGILGVVPTSGAIAGNAPGVATITFTPIGFYATYAITVDTVHPLPIVSNIIGRSAFCTGQAITLSNATTGGTWSCGDTSLASVDTSGNVTGLGIGNVPVSYTVVNSCGSASAVRYLSILPPATPHISISAVRDTSSYLGQIVNLSSTVTYEGLSPTYQWFLNGTAVPGATDSWWALENYFRSEVFCVLTSSLDCVTKSLDTSDTKVLYPNMLGINPPERPARAFLYPNPNNGDFTLQLPLGGTDDARVEICDAMGRVVLIRNQPIEHFSRISIPASTVISQSGQYMARIVTGAQSYTIPFAIIK